MSSYVSNVVALRLRRVCGCGEISVWLRWWFCCFRARLRLRWWFSVVEQQLYGAIAVAVRIHCDEFVGRCGVAERSIWSYCAVWCCEVWYVASRICLFEFTVRCGAARCDALHSSAIPLKFRCGVVRWCAVKFVALLLHFRWSYGAGLWVALGLLFRLSYGAAPMKLRFGVSRSGAFEVSVWRGEARCGALLCISFEVAVLYVNAPHGYNSGQFTMRCGEMRFGAARCGAGLTICYIRNC